MNYSTFELETPRTDQTPMVHCWRGKAEPRAFLVIAHGMGEHALRYAPLAKRMIEEDFAIFAMDQRGHGLAVKNAEQLGDYGEAGWNGLIEDQIALLKKLRGEHPGLPIIFLGHSMGSFVGQHLVTVASELMEGAALSGTSAMDALGAAMADSDGDLFGSMNTAFEPTRTEFDWLSRDEAQVDLYVADPLCGFTVTDASMATLAEAGAVFAVPEAIQKIRKDLPLYVFAGDMDPVGFNGELVRLVASRYQDAGIMDVELRLYEGARHEVFNETNRVEVMDDFAAWAVRVRASA